MKNEKKIKHQLFMFFIIYISSLLSINVFASGNNSLNLDVDRQEINQVILNLIEKIETNFNLNNEHISCINKNELSPSNGETLRLTLINPDKIENDNGIIKNVPLSKLDEVKLKRKIDFTQMVMDEKLKEYLKRFGGPEFFKSSKLNKLNFKTENIKELNYPGYLSYFNTASKTAYLTIHRLQKKHIETSQSEKDINTEKKREREKEFFADLRFNIEDQVLHSDYKNNLIYSRGHLTPNGDYYSPKSRENTFSTANIAPQVQQTFNDGLWSQLETQTRVWRDENKDLTVFTGVIFRTDKTHPQIEKLNNNILIPSHFYKIIVYEKEKELVVLPFVMENRVYESHERDFMNYIGQIDFIQSNTGIKIFPLFKNVKGEIEWNDKTVKIIKNKKEIKKIFYDK